MEANKYVDEEGKQKDREFILILWSNSIIVISFLLLWTAEIGDILDELSDKWGMNNEQGAPLLEPPYLNIFL